MKKFLILFMCILISITTIASASARTFEGEAIWAISTNQYVTGIIDPTKVENYLGPQCPPKPYVRGFIDNGLVREKGLQAYIVDADNQLHGFTELHTQLTIFSDFEEIVYTLVKSKCGYEPMTVLDYIFATMYFEDEYVGHVFFKTNIPKFYVGIIKITDKEDVIRLYMGDFDSDGNYELGFAAGCGSESARCCSQWEMVKCVTITQIYYIREHYKKTFCK